MGSVAAQDAILSPHRYTNLALNARAGLRPVLAVRPGGRSAGDFSRLSAVRNLFFVSSVVS